MDRVLKLPIAATAVPATKKAEGFRFLFPGEDSWEVWNRSASGSFELVEKTDPLKTDQRWSASSFLAIPLQHTLILPFWLGTRDLSLMAEMVWLQLERKGLLNGSRQETVMEYRVLREEAGRSLIAVCLLSEQFPESLGIKAINRYPLAVDLLSFPENQLVLWKELGRQVLVFTSGSEVVYSQNFSSENVDQNLIQEALCASLQLQSEGVLPFCAGITALGSYSRQDLEPLAHSLGVSVSIQAIASPSGPATGRSLTPYSKRVAQEKTRKSGQAKKIWIMAGLCYLALVVGVCGHLGWLYWKKQKLEKDLALHKNEVQTIRDAALRWESLELAILPETYPIEMIYRCTRQLPEEGVRLVTYDQSGTRILMTGEAKSSSAAFQFVQDLKKSKDLAAYQWEMPPPKLLPSDAAQFQIEGKRTYAPVDSK